MILFQNLEEEVIVYDNRFSGHIYITKEEPILCKYRVGDVLTIIYNEKHSLKSYNTITLLHISLENFIVIDSLPGSFKKQWRILMSMTMDTFMCGGSETIEDLDQKIRDIKLSELLYEKR
jgi:hypothetical protein